MPPTLLTPSRHRPARTPCRGTLWVLLGLLAAAAACCTSGCRPSGKKPVELTRPALLDRLREFGIQVRTVDDPVLGPRTLVVRLYPEHLNADGTVRADVWRVLRQLSHGILSFADTNFSDAGVAQCLSLQTVRGFDLTRTRVTGLGLQRLATRTDLKLLKLTGCRLVDADLAPLLRLKTLRLLYLNGCPVTDRALSLVGRLAELRALKLNRTKVTDAGVSELASLHRLQYLGLSGTPVTDRSLDVLSRLSELRFLDLRGTHVSRRRIVEFTKSVPACQVVYAPPPPERTSTTTLPEAEHQSGAADGPRDTGQPDNGR